jgi:hypothetical protein
MTSQSLLPTMLRGFFEDYLAAQRDVSPNTILASPIDRTRGGSLRLK